MNVLIIPTCVAWVDENGVPVITIEMNIGHNIIRSENELVLRVGGTKEGYNSFNFTVCFVTPLHERDGSDVGFLLIG